MFGPVVLATVVPDEDGQRSADDESQVPGPSRSQTPPTPPVQAACVGGMPPTHTHIITLLLHLYVLLPL